MLTHQYSILVICFDEYMDPFRMGFWPSNPNRVKIIGYYDTNDDSIASTLDIPLP